MNQQIVVNFLIHQRAMAYLTKCLPCFRVDLKEVATKAGGYYEYPDGSVQVEAPPAYYDLWKKLVPKDLLYEVLDEVDFNSHFSGLKPFGGKYYLLWYTAGYQKKLGGDTGLIVNPIPGPVFDDELRLDQLKVTVVFRRKTSDKVLRQLGECLIEWRQSVYTAGMFGEGPADSLSPLMEVCDGRVARFIIDVHRSGQNTLNWLTLCLLEFGYCVSPITHIYYDCEHNRDYPGKNFIELHAGVSLQNPRQMPILIAGKLAVPKASEIVEKEEPVSRWPGNSQPHPLVSSEDFPVLVTPKEHWDDLEVRVFFNRPVPPDARTLFQSLINSWLDIGSFGGWGGMGSAYTRAAEFDQTGDCAIFGADMGDALDASTALAVLVRVLEGFSIDVPIDAVLFGKLD